MLNHSNTQNPASEYVLFNFYQQVKDIVPVDGFILAILHQTQSYYSGDATEVTVHVGYYEPTTKPDGFYFFNINPNSAQFQHFYVYYSGVGYEYTHFNDYFSGPPTFLSDGTMTPEVRQYIDTQINSLAQHIEQVDSVVPVADINALQNVTNLVDQRLMYVESGNAIYAYDQQSVAIVDNDFVIASYNGVGRWLKVDNQNISGGTF